MVLEVRIMIYPLGKHQEDCTRRVSLVLVMFSNLDAGYSGMFNYNIHYLYMYDLGISLYVYYTSICMIKRSGICFYVLVG